MTSELSMTMEWFKIEYLKKNVKRINGQQKKEGTRIKSKNTKVKRCSSSQHKKINVMAGTVKLKADMIKVLN